MPLAGNLFDDSVAEVMLIFDKTLLKVVDSRHCWSWYGRVLFAACFRLRSQLDCSSLLLGGHNYGGMKAGTSCHKYYTLSCDWWVGALSCWNMNISPAVEWMAAEVSDQVKNIMVICTISFCTWLNEYELSTSRYWHTDGDYDRLWEHQM